MMNSSASNSSGGGGKRGRRSRGGAPMSEINVTPFVDVMLVLLIIFMIATPFLNVGVPLQLPETRATQELPRSDDEPITISIDAEGRLFMDESPTTLAALPDQLLTLSEQSETPVEEERVFIRVDGQANFEALAEVLGVLSEAGYRRINLPTRAAAALAAGSDDEQ